MLKSLHRILTTRIVVALGLVGWSLVGCGADHGDTTPGRANGPVACADLAGLSAPVVEIVAAEVVSTPTPEGTHPSTGLPLAPLPPHCKVTGVIETTINFELHLPLPEAWNGRFAMGGGGGFVGTVSNSILHPTPPFISALDAGYATAGTDTGHRGTMTDASWALGNEQAVRNFAGRAVHLVTEISREITEAHYGRPIRFSYFMGCSTGGGQAMMASQRYPDDYDGIVSGAPAFDFPALGASQLQTQQRMYPDPTQLSTPVVTPENRALLAREILAACDGIDGVEDGVLTDPRRCDFDPATLPRCPSAPGPDCLTGPQLDAIEAIYRGPTAGGKQLFPGFPFGAENEPRGWGSWITGGTAAAETEPDGEPPPPNLHFAFSTQMHKYLIFKDPDFDYASYDFDNWDTDTAAAAALLSATETDLATFGNRGGKMIFWHGWSDPALTALATIDYYEQLLTDTDGAGDFTRLYLMPGVLHCSGGPGADYVDWLGVISRWVEQEERPDPLVAEKRSAEGVVSFTRRLCPHPQTAEYDGQGDPEDAASYRCASD